MKFTDDSPAVIETVLEKSPAKEAKLQEEDQILEVPWAVRDLLRTCSRKWVLCAVWLGWCHHTVGYNL